MENQNSNPTLEKITQVSEHNYNAYTDAKTKAEERVYASELRKVTKINTKLSSKQDSLLKQREKYRKAVKESKDQIITSSHEQEKINELRLQISQRLKDIDRENPKVKQFLTTVEQLTLHREDFTVPELIIVKKVSEYSPIDEKYINSLKKTNAHVLDKINAVKEDCEVIKELKQICVKYVTLIDETISKSCQKLANLINPKIKENEEISAEIKNIKQSIEKISTEEEYNKIPQLTNKCFKTLLEKEKKNSLYIENLNYVEKKNLTKFIKQQIKAFEEEKYTYTPKVNLEATTLSNNKTTLLIETDKYNTVKRLYNEIRERRKHLHVIKIIEKHLQENSSNIVITKKIIYEYKKFHKKYEFLKAKKEKAKFEHELYESLLAFEEKFISDLTESVVAVRDKIFAQKNDLHKQQVSEVESLKNTTENNSQTIQITPEIKQKFDDKETVIQNSINELSRKLVTTKILEKEPTSMLEVYNFATEVNSVVIALLKQYSSLSQLKKYKNILFETKNEFLAKYEALKVKYKLQFEIDTYLTEAKNKKNIEELTLKYTDKDKKYLETEKRIREKIAYYKENVHKDFKGKKIEKQYNKLTKVQHFINYYRDELKVCIDYLNLSKENTLSEIKYTYDKHNEKLEDFHKFIEYQLEGGNEYAKKMMVLYHNNNEILNGVKKVYNKFETIVSNELNNTRNDANYSTSIFKQLEAKIEKHRETFNLTRNLQGRAVKTRKFSKKRTTLNRIKRAFVLIASCLGLGLIEFILPSWWVGLIVGAVLTVIFEIISFYTSPINYVEFDSEKNIITYTKHGERAFFFKNTEIINYSIEVFPSKLRNIYKSKIVLQVETGSDVYQFTYFDPINSEFVINDYIDKILNQPKNDLPLKEDYVTTKA